MRARTVQYIVFTVKNRGNTIYIWGCMRRVVGPIHAWNWPIDGDIFCRVMPNVSPYKLSKCSSHNDIHNNSVFPVSSGIQSLFVNIPVIIEIVLLVGTRTLPNWLMMVQSQCPPTGRHVDKLHYYSYQPCTLLLILLSTFCLNTNTVFHYVHAYCNSIQRQIVYVICLFCDQC